ncbi:hypothetical protein EVAR_50885_1 [Eumeta japonica]|uniref:Uncharacterized protein n=1 Tax=Eumeta variegata TaxID=151549 RepID=A0A4C1Y4E4_EUMVA|nr:hypothetical protein EVAR_50885_1 [Eumeta japonica]
MERLRAQRSENSTITHQRYNGSGAGQQRRGPLCGRKGGGRRTVGGGRRGQVTDISIKPLFPVSARVLHFLQERRSTAPGARRSSLVL